MGSIKILKKKLKLKIGYSDHSIGIEGSIATYAYGAEIIEKHLTINNNLEGPDHKASLNPKDFKKMVKCIRNIEKARTFNWKNQK